GDVVFRLGDPGDSFYVVLSGILELREGAPQARRMFAGSFFGELSLLFGLQRTVTVVAAIDSELVEIAHDLFHQIMEASPEFKANVRQMAVQRATKSGLPLPAEFT